MSDRHKVLGTKISLSPSSTQQHPHNKRHESNITLHSGMNALITAFQTQLPEILVPTEVESAR